MTAFFIIAALFISLRSCAAEKPTVIFRLDDVQSWWCEAQSTTVIDNFLQEGVPINVGMIGQYISGSPDMAAYLNGLADNPLVEFVSHSYKHQSFASRTVEWQVNDLTMANTEFEGVTGVRPKSFIPPFNAYSDNVFDAMKLSGMTILSSECAWNQAGTPEYGTPVYCPDGSDVVAPDILVDEIYRLPTGAVLGGMDYWTNYHSPASFDEALGWINAQIENQGFSVVMLHPVEFATDDTCDVMAPQKLSVLRQLLEYGKVNWNIQTYQAATLTLTNQPPATTSPTMSPTLKPTRADVPTSTSTRVAFRIDDVQSWWCEEPTKAVMDLFASEGVPLNVGLIGGFLSEWSSLVPYLQDKATSPLFEMVSNSNLYTAYSGQTLTWQRNDLAQSKVSIESLMGDTPSAFIPPQDSFDTTTFLALIAEGMTTFSPVCMWNLESSDTPGSPFHCPLGANSMAPSFKSNGVTTLSSGAVLGNVAYLNDRSGPASMPAAIAWMEAQIANQGFSVLRMSPYEFSTDSTCTTVNTDKINVLRSLLQYAKSVWQIKTFSEMTSVALPAPTPTPTTTPTIMPTPARDGSSSLKLDDDLTSLANWDSHLDGPSSSCVLTVANGVEESAISCSLTYCPTCFASQIRVASGLRSVVMPSSSGLYWVGFRLRVPSKWTYDGQSQSAVLVQIMRGDKSSDEFPIFALSLDRGTQFGIQTCGSSAPPGSGAAPVCSKSEAVAPFAKGQWLDWVVRLNMNYVMNGQGAVDVWVNGEMKLSTRPVLTSFNDVAPPYLQLGVSNAKWGAAVADPDDQNLYCPSFFQDGYVNGRCYRYSSTLENWHDASTDCADKGGRLVSSPDSFTYDWLQRNFNPTKTKNFWMGFNDVAKEGDYVWDRAANSNKYYDKWDTNQPTKGTSSNCAYMYGATGKMRSDACNNKREYACELDMTKKDVDYYCPAAFRGAYYDGFCYSLQTTRASWGSASADCSSKGGWLTSVQSEDTYLWLVDTFKSERQVWIGLNDNAKEGTFVWDNGDTEGYILWDRYEPSGGDCGILMRSGPMRDRFCFFRYAYICQAAAIPRSVAPTPAPLDSLNYAVDVSQVKVGDAGSCFNEVSTSASTASRTCVSTFSLGIESTSSTKSDSSGDSTSTSSDSDLYLSLLVTCLILIAAMMVVIVAMFMRQSSAIEAAVQLQVMRKDYNQVSSDTDDHVAPDPLVRVRGSRFVVSSPLHPVSSRRQQAMQFDKDIGQAV